MALQDSYRLASPLKEVNTQTSAFFPLNFYIISPGSSVPRRVGQKKSKNLLSICLLTLSSTPPPRSVRRHHLSLNLARDCVRSKREVKLMWHKLFLAGEPSWLDRDQK